MGKRDKKEIERNTQRTQAQAERDYGGVSRRAQAQLPGAMERDLALKDSASQGFRNVMGGPDMQNAMGWAGDMARTGGINPQDAGAMRDYAGQMAGVYQDQGLLDQLRGYGQFKNFAETGGFGAGEIERGIRRGSDAGSAMFQGLQNQNRTAQNAGWSGPGSGAQDAMLRSGSMRDIMAAATDAEQRMMQEKRGGQMWGAGQGLASGAEIGRGQQAGFGGAANIHGQLGQMEQQGRLGGLGAMQGLFGTQLGGASGLGSLYGMRPGETGMYLDQNLAGIGGRTGAGFQGSSLGIQNKEPGIFDKLLAAGAGVAPAFFPQGGSSAAPAGGTSMPGVTGYNPPAGSFGGGSGLGGFQGGSFGSGQGWQQPLQFGGS